MPSEKAYTYEVAYLSRRLYSGEMYDIDGKYMLLEWHIYAEENMLMERHMLIGGNTYMKIV